MTNKTPVLSSGVKQGEKINWMRPLKNGENKEIDWNLKKACLTKSKN